MATKSKLWARMRRSPQPAEGEWQTRMPAAHCNQAVRATQAVDDGMLGHGLFVQHSDIEQAQYIGQAALP
jgi:hypothetical protein